MRVSLHRWAMATLLCGIVGLGAGCKGGTSSQPSGGWLSWGKKQDSSTAVAATRPSAQSPPSPAQTAGAGTALTAAGAPGAYPSTGMGAGGYPASPANNTAAGANAQHAGYFTGPYGTNGAAGGGNPAYTADSRASAYPSTNSPPAGNYSPYGGTGGYGNAGAAAPAAPAASGGGYAPQGYAPQGYAPQNYAPQNYAPQGYAPSGASNYAPHQGVAPASVPANGGGGQWDAEPANAQSSDAAPGGVVPASPYASRDGGYRPGSTGRSRPVDGLSPGNAEAVRPAGYNGQGGSFQPGGNQNPY